VGPTVRVIPNLPTPLSPPWSRRFSPAALAPLTLPSPLHGRAIECADAHSPRPSLPLWNRHPTELHGLLTLMAVTTDHTQLPRRALSSSPSSYKRCPRAPSLSAPRPALPLAQQQLKAEAPPSPISFFPTSLAAPRA
jgi:hypothetical protein